MAYFIRRAGDGCAVIALHPDDHEEVSASGMAIAAAEDLCVSKIDALRSAAPALPSTDAGRAAAGVQILSHATCRPRSRFMGNGSEG